MASLEGLSFARGHEGGADAARYIRDLIALSTLPSVWLGANADRIAESLLAAIDATIRPDFGYIRMKGQAGRPDIEIVHCKHEQDRAAFVNMAVAIAEWARTHDPEDILRAPLNNDKRKIHCSIYPLGYGEMGILAMGFFDRDPDQVERTLLNVTANHAITACKNTQLIAEAETSKREAEALNEVSRTLVSELDLHAVVQKATDAATRLTGAKFGAFFYNVVNEQGEAFMLYTLSGAPREAFEKMGHPRATALFGPTFRGEPPIRIDDVRKDSRYGTMGPHHGMPKGHLPVVSYLAVPVVSRSGEVIGGLFFGHPEPSVFNERSEKLVVGMAAQAAIAIDNARLYENAQREITERRKAEQSLREAQTELHQHAEKLEEEVAQRTSQLRETIQELEAFSYSVSHDMRSPLRAMQGYAEALLEEFQDKLGSTGVEYLTRIRRSSRRMDMLIQDVLAYSKVAKGDIELKVVSVETVIRDVIQNYPALQSDRAEISVEAPIPPITGHEAYLTQIVSNLLTNAIKFVEPGKKPVVTIRSRVDGEMVRIEFEDNGIGISAKHQKQIFQIFGRVYPDKQYEGTGIGLAIAKKAAERTGGSLGVESELGRGSKFFVLLKRAT